VKALPFSSEVREIVPCTKKCGAFGWSKINVETFYELASIRGDL
jgi:hypothetical protein